MTAVAEGGRLQRVGRQVESFEPFLISEWSIWWTAVDRQVQMASMLRMVWWDTDYWTLFIHRVVFTSNLIKLAKIQLTWTILVSYFNKLFGEQNANKPAINGHTL